MEFFLSFSDDLVIFVVQRKSNSMKKAIFSALLITVSAVIASCNKEASNEKPSQERFFSYEMTGTSMYTRSVTSEAVLSIINGALPEHISCTFEGSKFFVVNTGEYTPIPSDTYQVTGTHLGDIVGGILTADYAGVTLSPSIRINQPLTITDEETDYTLSGSYNCFALVWDDAVVERIEFQDVYGKTYEMPSLTQGDTRLVFVQGELRTNYLNLTVYPKDTETYTETTFTIATMSGSGLSKAEFGKWYMLNPTFGGNQPKWLGLDLPPFTQGEF